MSKNSLMRSSSRSAFSRAMPVYLARISGEDAIPAYVAGDAVNMKLLFQFLHDIHVPFTRPIRPADNLSYNR